MAEARRRTEVPTPRLRVQVAREGMPGLGSWPLLRQGDPETGSNTGVMASNLLLLTGICEMNNAF